MSAGRAAAPSSGWDNSRLGGWIDRLARWPRWVVLGLSMVLAASVGFLLERVILSGWKTLLGGPDFFLAAVGVLAAVFASMLWGASHASAARRGAFIHAVAEDRLPRHLAEDALLRSTVTSTWPRAVVMPFRLVPLQRHAWQDSASQLAQIIRDQAEASRVANPSIRGVSILAGGPTCVLAVAGALTQCLLRDLNWTVRLIADDTSEVARPFIEFPLRRDGQPVGQQESGEGPVAVFLLLRKGHVDDKHDQLRGAIQDSLRPKFGEVPVRVVEFVHPIKEADTAYVELLSKVHEELIAVVDQGIRRVFLQSQAPASLTFAAGFSASGLGLEVASMDFSRAKKEYIFPIEVGHDPWASHRAARESQAQPPEGATELADQHYRRLGRSWWWTLALSSLALGVFSPLFAGSIALLLEWMVAKSQSGAAGAGDWVQLVLIFIGAGLVLVVSYSWTAPRLDRPEVRLTATPGRSTLSRRFAQIPALVLGRPGQDLAEGVTSQFSDLVAALPGAQQVAVDLGERALCPHGEDAVFNPEYGLGKSLRGNRPIPLTWNGQSTTTGPVP